MSLLKRIPLHFKGELHDVRLINFTVDMEEVVNAVPPGIKVRDFNGRAMISMVDVQLKNMRAVAAPFVPFNYRHVAFRLLVEDSVYNDGLSKGIYFMRSFTNQRMIVTGGRLLTDYNLSLANIADNGSEVIISQGKQFVKYSIRKDIAEPNKELKATIGSLDRAYSMLHRNVVRVTQIQREKWPIQEVNCGSFETTFFKSARLVGAFRVNEIIYYDWLPPRTVQL